jgi:hypothetical protein
LRGRKQVSCRPPSPAVKTFAAATQRGVGSSVRVYRVREAPGQELHLVGVAGFAPSPFEAEFGRHVAVPLAQSDPQRPPLARFFTEGGAEAVGNPF